MNSFEEHDTQALDGTFVNVLYIIKYQFTVYLTVKFQVGWTGNKEVTVYPTAFGAVCSHSYM